MGVIIIPRKKTAEEYKKDFYNIVNEEFELLSEYIGSNKGIKVKHNVCGTIRTVRADKLYTKHGIGCLKCTNINQTKDENTFKVELDKATNGEFELVGKYVNNKTKTEFRHVLCGNTFYAYPNNLKRHSNCKYCRPIGTAKSPKTFREEINYRLEEYELVSEYISERDKITVVHKRCGNKWELYPRRFIRGDECPYCKHSSKGESMVRSVLKDLDIYFVEQKTFEGLKYKAKLRYDFYIPSKNIAIEYQGVQHYRPYSFGENSITKYEEQVVRDNLKREFSKNNDIILIEIPYYIEKYEDIKKEIEKYL